MTVAVELPPRVASKINFEGAGGCWLWQATCNHLGYGQVHWNGVTASAHRLVYKLVVGPIPEGKVLDHLCRVHHCVNPRHLEPVTQQENTVRGISANRIKTHCPQGHEYTPKNTLVSKTGARFCRTCNRPGQRRLRAAERQAAN